VFLYQLIFLDSFKLLPSFIFHFSYFCVTSFFFFLVSLLPSLSSSFVRLCHFLLYLFYKSLYLFVSFCCLYIFISLFLLPLFHPLHLSSFLTHFSFFPYFCFFPFVIFIYPFVSLHSLYLYVSCTCCSLISFASFPFSVPCCPYSLFLLPVPPSLPQLPVH